MTNTNFTLLFLPIDKDSHPDNRFHLSLERIRTEIGEQVINELIDFHSHTNQLQKGYARQGLALAVAVFKEAIYLHHHHRFDDDNPYGYKSRELKQQAQQTLERIGFTKNNAHKFVSTANWLTRQYFSKDEKAWFDSLSVSHLYELSRMSEEAFNYVKQEVAYPEFHFSAGQQSISVRRLEDIRRSHAKKEVPSDKTHNFPQTTREDTQGLQEVCRQKVLEVATQQTPELSQLVPVSDTDQVSNTELIEQFKCLAEAIDWSAIREFQSSRVFLTQMAETLSLISDLANDSCYTPCL